MLDVSGTSSWKEQFTEALTVSGGDDDEEGASGSSTPSTTDYLMHSLTIFWKVLFAFVPPTGKYTISLSKCFFGRVLNFLFHLQEVNKLRSCMRYR